MTQEDLYIKSPKGLQIPIEAIQKELIKRLDWLKYCYNICERIGRPKNNGNQIVSYYTPVFYYESGEYIELLPRDFIGSHGFFYLHDYTEYDIETRDLKATVSLIMWFDFRDIYLNDYRNIQDVKRQVEKILLQANYYLPSVSYLKLSKVYEKFENVWKEFSYKEVEQFANVHPYGHLRFEFVIGGNLECLEND